MCRRAGCTQKKDPRTKSQREKVGEQGDFEVTAAHDPVQEVLMTERTGEGRSEDDV